MRKPQNKNLKMAGWLLFYLYIVLLSYFLFFSEYFNRTEIAEDYQVNLELFKEIKRYFYNWRSSIGLKNFLINIPGNILAFVPFGFLLPLLSKNYRKFIYISFLSVVFSLVIELVQYRTRVGSFDVDDILLNTIGGMLGFLFYVAGTGFNRRLQGKKQKGKV